MRVLYHYWLSPPCRKLRLLLREKALEFELQLERPWDRRDEFLALNPAGEPPVLVEEDGTVVADSTAITEYLEEVYPSRSLLGGTPAARAETRRLISWFEGKLAREVTDNLLGEKVLKRYFGLGQPSSAAVRAGHTNIRPHLEYIGWLADHRNWLAGDDFSLADIAAAAQLSVLDYLDDVPWDEHQGARDWYARVKSRPSFRPLLADHVPGLPPPDHYADLDF
jgi:glutathione S-transferase